MILNIRKNNRKVYINEGQCKLIMEYYGLPNNIDDVVDFIIGKVNQMWGNGNYDSFTIPFNGLPFGYLEVRPTTMNLRASYVIPPIYFNKPCVILINPDRVLNGENEEGYTFHATLVHELTHMIEDIGRRGSSENGLGDEMTRIGHMKAFDNVIKNGVLRDDNKSYGSIEKAVNRVIYHGVGFERNARNAAMFTKLKDLPAGSIRSYDDAIRFLRSTGEYSRYERSVACAWFLVNLTDEADQMRALYAVRQCSDYRFKNWNSFRKWLKQFIRRYENKMNTIIPKMINHVINGN